MPKISKIIDEAMVLKAEKALRQIRGCGVAALRLKAIIASSKHGLKKVAEVYDINRGSLHRWIGLFRDKGALGIENIGKPPRSKLSSAQKEEVAFWINEDSAITIKKLKILIKERYDIDIGKSSVHRMLQKLGFSHITGRKRHYKSDQSSQEEFKKNLHEVHKERPNVPIYLCDESRFGTHAKHGLGWFKKGSRTAIATKLGFKLFYLYSATNHKTGDAFSLIISNVDKQCMQVFMYTKLS